MSTFRLFVSIIKHMPTFRHRVFTNFQLDFDYKHLVNTHEAKYIAYGEETCPTTDRLHHQGWISFVKPKRTTKSVATVLGNCHVEPMKGNLAQNDEYCSKQTGGILTEFGTRPQQGARTDPIKIKKNLEDGTTTVDDIVLDQPAIYHQYCRTLREMETILLRRKKREWMTEGVWYYGPTAVGKSHKAFEGYDYTTHYVKCLDDQWWDGYKGQEIVILNDFRGQINYSEMLQLCDKWHHTVRQRNREPVPFLARKIIVTSSLHPKELYDKLKHEDSITQLLRRFEIILMDGRSHDHQSV